MEKKLSEKEWPLEAGDSKCDETIFSSRFHARESKIR